MEKIPVDSGLYVETVGKACRNKTAYVFIALLIFSQQNQVGIVIIPTVLLVSHTTGCNIDLAADNGLYACFFACLIKGHCAVHYAVVCYGDGALAHFLQLLGELVYAAGSVQQGELSMNM